MSRTAELERHAPFENVATSASADGRPRIVPLRQPARSDRVAGIEAVAGNVGEPWLQHGLANVGDVSSAATISSDWSSSQAIYQAARAHRAFVLGELAAVAMQIVADFVRSMAERYRRRRREFETREALYQLGDRTLHDLGIDRSEIASIAAETAGASEVSRTRVANAQSSASGR
jgi:uncharacterized protein YjiS (DUF1127 family)